MAPSIEEVRVAKGDVLRSHVDQLFDVGDYDVLRYESNPSSVDDRHGAVATLVSAAMTCLDVADLALGAVQGEMGIAIEFRQQIARREHERIVPELNQLFVRSVVGSVSPCEPVRPGHQRTLVFPGDDAVRHHSHGANRGPRARRDRRSRRAGWNRGP